MSAKIFQFPRLPEARHLENEMDRLIEEFREAVALIFQPNPARGAYLNSEIEKMLKPVEELQA